MPEVLGMRHSGHFTPSPSHKFYCLVNLRCLNLRHVITFNSETVSGVPRTPLIYPSSHSPCVLASVVLSILSIYVLLLSQVSEVAQSCPTLKPARLLCPWDFQARVLEWVAISFSRRSSRSRGWTQVSCTAGRLFTVWATREEPFKGHHITKAVYKVIASCVKCLTKKSSREFPGGPEVRTPHFHRRGHRSLARETCMP